MNYPWHKAVVEQFPHWRTPLLLIGASEEEAAALAHQLLLNAIRLANPSIPFATLSDNPDVLIVKPQDDKITIDVLRGIDDFLSLAPIHCRQRGIVIQDIHTAMRDGLDALLLTLENTQKRSLIVLTTTKTSSLPATLLSRCQRVPIPHPSSDELVELMKQSDISVSQPLIDFCLNQPTRIGALAKQSDHIVEFTRMLLAKSTIVDGAIPYDWSVAFWLEFLQKFCSDAIRVLSNGCPIYFRHCEEKLASLVANTQTEDWFMFYQSLGTKQRQSAITLQKQILLNQVQHEYRRIFAD